jgi:hypothetical protein
MKQQQPAVTLQELEDQAQSFVNSIQNSPQQRLQAREDFYNLFGFYPLAKYGYGHSEIAFLNWEISRGVLNPSTDPKPGSAWWSLVNLTLIYNAKLAELITASQQTFSGVPPSTQAWLNYIQNPGPKSWYIAHNYSIALGYISCTTQALQETQYEQMFMNEVISRLFYAQAMVEGQPYAFGKMGEILSNPAGDAVEAMVHMPDFYPPNYPLTQEDIQHVMHIGTGPEMDLERFLDEVLIGPNLVTLFNFVSGLLGIPELNNFVQDGKLVYPNIQTTKKSAAAAQ